MNPLPSRVWRIWSLLFFFLPSYLPAEGVVVETVEEASAPEKAGMREGDVFHTWTRPAHPPLNPEPASGRLLSPFDWQWMEIEQAPRGTVELRGERGGVALVVQVAVGRWDTQVRPVLPGELEDLYRRGRELVDRRKVEEGTSCWQQLAARAGERGDWRLQAWIWLRIARTREKAKAYPQAESAYEAALRESRDPIARVTVLDAMGSFFLSQKRLDEAEDSFRHSLELKEASWGASLQVAQGKFYLGSMAAHRADASVDFIAWDLTPDPAQRHRWTLAEEQIEGALALEERWAPGGVATARILTTLGRYAMSQLDRKKSLTYLERSLSVNQGVQPVSPGMAEPLMELGSIAFMDGDQTKARLLYQQALSALGPSPAPSVQMGQILGFLSSDAAYRGDFVEAEHYNRRSLAVATKVDPESLAILTILNALGSTSLRRLDLDSAEEYFKRALELGSGLIPESRLVEPPLESRFEARNRRLQLTWSLISLGELAEKRGDFASAERYIREALAFHERNDTDDWEREEIWRSLAFRAIERGDLAAAERYFQLLTQRGDLAVKRGDRPAESQRRSQIRSLVALGKLALKRGRLKEAENHLREYLASRTPRDAPNPQAFQTLARVLRQRGRLQEAAKYADLSIEALEAEIGRLAGSEEAKGNVRGRDGDIYRDALSLQLALRRPTEAFNLLERFRAQSFLALLAQRDLAWAAELPPELESERRRVAGEYDRIQLRLAALDPEKDREAIEALRREQLRLRRRREEIADEVRRKAPRLETLRNPSALTFEEVREALDPGTVMLSYSVGEEQTHLFLVAQGQGLQVKTLEIGRRALEQDIGRLRQLIDQTQAGSGLGANGLDWFSRRLYERLVEPAEKWIAPGERIVFVPDGPLHLLPFAALIRKDGRHLVEWKPLSTVLSGTVFAELKRQRRGDTVAGTEPSSRQWVAFGDPWFPPRLAQSPAEDIEEFRLRSFSTRARLRWKRLPESRREVEEIAELFPADRRQTYVDRAALEERAKEIGKGVRILHFATHGFVDDRSPFDSGLVLSIPEELAEGRDNGLLQVWEIFESLRLDADLVVLSACETGIGEIRGGEGMIGLTRAFQYAGARSVLASLWRVEDAATAELMQRFYRHLLAGKAKDEALREAQLELIRSPLRVPDGRGGWTQRSAATPYFWAALQLVGDGR